MTLKYGWGGVRSGGERDLKNVKFGNSTQFCVEMQERGLGMKVKVKKGEGCSNPQGDRKMH